MNTRHRFLIILAILFLSWVSVNAQERPNILFLFSDDQRADAVGAFGNPYIKTPNIDKLCHSGVRFTNNYCMGSHHGAVCAPSRAMLMSGRTLFRVYDKLEGVETMPEVLGKNGYITFGTGKWHNEKIAFSDAFQYGEDIFFGGMSDHFNIPVVDKKRDGTFSEITRKGFSTEVFTNAAIRFLEKYASDQTSAPFFVYVAYTVPHDPRSPDSDYIGMYDENNLPLPANFKSKHPFKLGDMTIRDENLGAWPRTPEQIGAQLADYYGLITHLDDEIGRILNTLKRLDLFENTIIVFTSDHGLAIGSHGLLGKQNLYEHSMKSPLVISGPGVPINQTTDALVYLYDLFPTLCSMVSVPVPEDVEGKDMSPVIYGEMKEIRPSLFISYGYVQRAVRDQRWKLIQYPAINHTQLFDLLNDPYELNNLAERKEHADRLGKMWKMLENWQIQSGDTLQLVSDNPASGAYDLTDYQRKPDMHQPEYTLDKYFRD